MSLLNNTAFKALVDAWITTNGIDAISGAKLNEILNDIPDSFINKVDGASLIGINEYSPSQTYIVGSGCFYQGKLFQAIVSTTGTFNINDWALISDGSVGGGGGYTSRDIFIPTNGQTVFPLSAVVSGKPLLFLSGFPRIQGTDYTASGTTLTWLGETLSTEDNIVIYYGGASGGVETSPIVASFTANPLTGDIPLTVNFTNNSTGATSSMWDFGDGNTSGDENPTHEYETAGIFLVSLVVFNDDGYSASLERIITCAEPNLNTVMRSFRVVISPAEIMASGSVPVLLVEHDDETTEIDLISASCKVMFNTAPYIPYNIVTGFLQIDTADYPQLVVQGVGGTTDRATRAYGLNYGGDPGGLGKTQYVAGKGLYFTIPNSNLITAGDSDIVISGFYMIKPI